MPITKEFITKAFQDLLWFLKSGDNDKALDSIEKTIEAIEKTEEDGGAGEAEQIAEENEEWEEAPAGEVVEEEKKIAEQVKKYVDMYISSYDILAVVEALKGIDANALKTLIEKTAKFDEVAKKVEKMSEWVSKQAQEPQQVKKSVFDGMFTQK